MTRAPPIESDVLTPRRLAAWRGAAIPSSRAARKPVWLCRGIAIAAGILLLARVTATIGTFSNIVDEPYHIASAVALYDVGRHAVGTEQPPLARLVPAIPLALSGVHLPPDRNSRVVQGLLESGETGAAVLFHSSIDYETILRRARLAMLVFPLVALAYVYLLGRWIAGEGAGALGAVLFSLDPSLLGHAMWVATDVAACALFLAAVYHVGRWMVFRRTRHAALGGAAIGLAIATKFSLVVLLPATLVLAVLFPLTRVWRRRRVGLGRFWHAYRRRLPSAKQLLLAGVVAFLTLWATFLFDVGPISQSRVFVGKPEWDALPGWIKETPIPMPSLVLGAMELYGHNRFGHLTYLNGDVGVHGWWWYFPEVIALKTPLSALAAMAVGFALSVRMPRRILRRELIVLVPAALLFAAALRANIDIGVRHILPVIPALYLLATIPLSRLRRRAVPIGFVFAILVETATIHPYYLGYFNRLAGGSVGGDRYLLDSNLDWGQDVALLAGWLHAPAQSGRTYTLNLFCYPPDDLPRQFGLDPTTRPSPQGLYAISKNIRHGLMGVTVLDRGERIVRPSYAWLDHYRHVATIGTSIDVYDLDAPLSPLSPSTRPR